MLDRSVEAWRRKPGAIAVGVFIFSCLLPVAVQAASRAENFVLLDHQGKAQELYYQRDAKHVVLVSHANRCPDSVASAKAAEALQSAHPEARVYLIVPVDDRAAMLAFAEANDL